MSALISYGEPLIFMSAVHKNGRMQLSAREGCRSSEAARRGGNFAENREALSYGG